MRGIAFAPGSTGISAARRPAAAVLSALALAGVAGAAPTWTVPVELSAAERVVAPDLALNGAGDAVVVWNREEGEVCPDAPANPACKHVVEVTSRVPGSTAWQPPVPLAEPGVGSGPRAAVDEAGNAVAVWSHDVGEPRFLQASYRRGRGGPWDSPIDLSDDRFREGTQQVGFDSAGNVVAAWTRSGPSGTVVQATVRAADSGIWGSPVDLSRPDSAAGTPSLAVGSAGSALVGWVLTTGVVQTAAWTGAWQSPVDLASGAGSGVDVALSRSGDAVAVWIARTGAVRAAFRPAGSGWTSAVDIAAAARPASSPQVALDPAGTAHVVWLGGTGPTRVQASTRSRASATWSAAAAVSAPNREASDPQVAVDSAGNAVAAWTEADAGTRASIRPTAGSWQPPVELSRPSQPARGVRVAFGRVGAALVVWSRLEPPRVRVEASDLAGGGPVVGDLAVPARAGAGMPVAMSVGAWPWASPLAGEPAWSFGDGTSAHGRSVRHAYARPGSYTVVVTQADASGATSTADALVVVAVRPVANVRRPTIQGQPRVGATLTCSPGLWTGTPPIRFRFRWLRNGRPVAGATARRFRVRASDGGALLACRARASNAGSSRTAVSLPVRIRRSG